ncbi:MAG: hybrid sensor histidine kinase/response regulator [Pseudomonadota bacterium]
MDDLLSEFLTETHESLDVVDVQLVQFEADPNDASILDNVFRLVHTIKGTCGFLGLPRLEALAHSGETLMGKYRDGAPVTKSGVSLILKSIDRIKDILGDLAATGTEPEGSDEDLISALDEISAQADTGGAAAAEDVTADDAAPQPEAAGGGDEEPLPLQIVERELKPGEVSLDDLERAFQEADGPGEFEVPDAAAWVNEISNEGEGSPDGADTDADVAAKDDAVSPAAEAPPPASEPAKPEKAAKPAPQKKPAEEGARNEPVATTQSIRVNVDTLEHLITMVSELVLTRNQLLEIARRHEESEFKVPLQRLSNVTAELQEGVMKTRMQPIGNAWQKLPRIVRDLANELGKDIELEMIGAETELDRQVLELIKDPLTHMVRNSADHGLEDSAGREAAGKSKKGIIRLSAYHEGGHINIEIADDGRGINAEKLKSKIVEKGLASEVELDKMTEAQIQRFIFHPGFSMAAKVTNVSGRGVGMDVVKTNIDLIGGSIDLKSVLGEGTTFVIKIPLTLAIVSALIVECAGQRFAIPQLAVVELVRAQANSEHRIERIKDTPVLRLRNKLLPLVGMRAILGLADGAEPSEEDAETGFIVVTRVGGQTFGIVVDGVFHTEEIVVKPMSSLLRDITVFSGNTILGDGSVIMIIDPNGITRAISADIATEVEEHDGKADVDARDREDTTALLVFRAGSEDPKAVPLSLVTRLEEIDITKIERADGRDLVQYRGQLMPLVFLNDEVERREAGGQPMLVFSDMGRSMGLAIDEIVDIVEDRLAIEVSSAKPGIVGTSVIKERATEVVDVAHYLPMAFPDWFTRKDPGLHKGNRILLVDDSPFFREMLEPVLRSAGYDLVICDNGRTALNELEREGAAFDAVISDIEMPEMDGFRLAESINAHPRLRDLPIVALSSHTDREYIERGRRAGFYDFVAKFDRQGLLAALDDLKDEPVIREQAA